MPTGFEEAGLALAIFPLLVSVIEQYRQGLGMIATSSRCQNCIDSSNRRDQELDSVQEITSQPPPDSSRREASICECMLQTGGHYQ